MQAIVLLDETFAKWMRIAVFRLSKMAARLKGNHKGCPYGKTRVESV